MLRTSRSVATRTFLVICAFLAQPDDATYALPVPAEDVFEGFAIAARGESASRVIRMNARPDASRSLASEYTRAAATYATHWAPTIAPIARRLLQELPLVEARRVLDMGCGTGELLGDLRCVAPDACIVGVDRSEGMLQAVRHRGGCPLAVMDAVALALVASSFDVAVLAFVLFHLPDASAGLHEILRVLRPRGTAGIVVWGQGPDTPGSEIWKEELDRHSAEPDPRDPSVAQHALMNTPEKLAELLDSSGFCAVRAWRENHEHRFALRTLVELHVGCGMPARRLATLPQLVRVACRARVETRLAELGTEGLVFRPEIVYAVASRPD